MIEGGGMENLEDLEGNFPSPAKQEFVVIHGISFGVFPICSHVLEVTTRALMEERVPCFLGG